jgi:hypothetical protein
MLKFPVKFDLIADAKCRAGKKLPGILEKIFIDSDEVPGHPYNGTKIISMMQKTKS